MCLAVHACSRLAAFLLSLATVRLLRLSFSDALCWSSPPPRVYRVDHEIEAVLSITLADLAQLCCVCPSDRLTVMRMQMNKMMKLGVKELIKLCIYCWGHPLLYTCSGSVAVWMLLSGNLQHKRTTSICISLDLSQHAMQEPEHVHQEWLQLLHQHGSIKHLNVDPGREVRYTANCAGVLSAILGFNPTRWSVQPAVSGSISGVTKDLGRAE
jgi:hypothetical protein